MVNILFICSQNRLRSPTAEQMFCQYAGIECASAGVYDSAEVPLDPELIEWADIIFVMERIHYTKMTKKFKRYLNNKRIIVLGIPDEYEYMDPTLIHLLEIKVIPLIRSHLS
ncbi:MAG: phosphotyrosine protein phosphatase [Thiothrix sp.]|nr:MAG: phosphotyrosine protein phosphatase [Thiothrix sp.]